MSKYDSRVNKLKSRADKLFRKLNVFISKEDHALIRDYYKAMLDDTNITPDVLENINAQIDIINEEFSLKKDDDYDRRLLELSNDKDYMQKLLDVLNNDNASKHVGVHHLAEMICKLHPEGEWLTKKNAEYTLPLLQKAKAYLSKRKLI